MTQADLFSAPLPRPTENVRGYRQRPAVESETSVLAAIEAAPMAGTQRARVLSWLREHGPATDEQIQDALALSANSERPRRRELEKARLVRQVGVAKSKSGRAAVLWGVV